MDVTEYHHWKYRIVALTREVEFIHDTVNMAAAYRAPVTMEDRIQHQKDLDMANYLLAEATHMVAVADAEAAGTEVKPPLQEGQEVDAVSPQ